jgi:hypothetical protein
LLAAAPFAAGCGAVRTAEPIRGPRTEEPVRVRVQSPRPVELWSAGTDDSARVCKSPCDERVPVEGRQFEVRVAELPDSPRFVIPPTTRGALVRVQPSRQALVGAGATLGTLGGAGMVVGGVIALADVAGNENFARAAAGGLITVAVGSAVLAGGIVCAALGGTEVDIVELADAGRVRF